MYCFTTWLTCPGSGRTLASLAGLLKTDALVQRMGALSQPAYRRYWLGSLASVGSVQLIIVGQGWLIVNELGGSPIDLGYLGAASALPTIAVNMFGGVVADRVNRRMLLIITSALVAALLAVQALTGDYRGCSHMARHRNQRSAGAGLRPGMACEERLLSGAHRAGAHHERGGAEFNPVARGAESSPQPLPVL